MRLAFILVFSMFLLPSSSMGKSKHVCSKKEAIEAENNVLTRDWEGTYISFKKFSHCDSGAIAEGFSDSVSEIFANKWGDLHVFIKIIKKDKLFEKFALSHLDDSMSLENSLKIINNSTNNCPHNENELCAKIRSAAAPRN